ncbi:hypothetical protein [Corynebacterium mastitidis]|uniref:hypothetical protein n=1 Tax=Corynebacterium mastitidis TaxID=161890 RepID=UPI0012EA7463|nr:hypothetical protein [Corynebacterium mastitidis]
MNRIVKISTLVFLTSLSPLLSSCSTDSKDDQALLAATEKAASERGIDSGNVILTLANIYGDEWKEYVALCSDAPRNQVAEALSVKESDLPELQQDDNALLRLDGTKVAAEVHPKENFLLCSGINAPAYRITSETVSISDGRQLPPPLTLFGGLVAPIRSHSSSQVSPRG